VSQRDASERDEGVRTEMASDTDVPTIIGGKGIRLRVESAQPLTQRLVDEVNGFCDQVEDAGGERVGVLELRGPAPGEAGQGEAGQGEASTGGPGPGEAGAPDASAAVWPGEPGIHLVNRWERAVTRTERLAAPTVALVPAGCSGPATELLLTADCRIGSPDTRLSLGRQPSGVLWPGMALHRLVHQIGMARARRLALFDIALTAPEAYGLGLLDEVTERPAAALTAALDRARELDGTEVAMRRRLLIEAGVTSREDALGVHLAACDRTLRRLGAAAATMPAPVP
jgi:isomerase DpgB